MKLKIHYKKVITIKITELKNIFFFVGKRKFLSLK